jgi:hypothetical protein
MTTEKVLTAGELLDICDEYTRELALSRAIGEKIVTLISNILDASLDFQEKYPGYVGTIARILAYSRSQVERVNTNARHPYGVADHKQKLDTIVSPDDVHRLAVELAVSFENAVLNNGNLQGPIIRILHSHRHRDSAAIALETYVILSQSGKIDPRIFMTAVRDCRFRKINNKQSNTRQRQVA